MAAQTEEETNNNPTSGPSSRRSSCPLVSRRSQLPVQARAPPGPPLHLPGEARLGPVLLQDCSQGGQLWPGPQEPTSFHCYEPHRPQSGTGNTGCKSLSSDSSILLPVKKVQSYDQLN